MKCIKTNISATLRSVHLVIYDKGRLHCFSHTEWARRARCSKHAIRRRLESSYWTDRQTVGFDPPPKTHREKGHKSQARRHRTIQAKKKLNPPRTAMHNFLTRKL